jgi:hypothetical protein
MNRDTIREAICEIRTGLEAGSGADRSVGWIAACDRGLGAVNRLERVLAELNTGSPVIPSAAPDGERECRKLLRELRAFVFLTKVRDFSGLTEEELLESQYNVAEEAAGWLARIDAVLQSRVLPLNSDSGTQGLASTGYPMAYGDGSGEKA